MKESAHRGLQTLPMDQPAKSCEILVEAPKGPMGKMRKGSGDISLQRGIKVRIGGEKSARGCRPDSRLFGKIFIIAEAGSNHNGDLDTAVELLYKAKEAGADGIKFQDYSLNTLFSPSYYEEVLGIKNSEWREKIEKYSFKPEWHKRISETAEKIRIHYFSTPFHPGAVDILDEYTPFYKIASGDITYLPLLEKIGERGKGVFISTGAANLSEIDNAVRILTRYNLPFICIMHCVMLYPPPYSSLHLNFIDTLRKRYNLPVGYSDHTLGMDASLLAVGMGIKALEKHFTLNKKQDGYDHRNSLDPAELRILVKKIRIYEEMLGRHEKVITEREERERVFARRGIYTKVELKKGDKITVNTVRFLRPNTSSGVGAEDIYTIVDKVLARDVPAGTALEYAMFEQNAACIKGT